MGLFYGSIERRGRPAHGAIRGLKFIFAENNLILKRIRHNIDISRQNARKALLEASAL